LARADLIIRGREVHTPAGPVPASIHIAGGRIEQVGPFEHSESCPVIDAGEMPVLPGLVDTHVHINEPGRTEWEGFATATRAAAAGGVTTLVDMPLNSVPASTSVDGLRAKIAAARGQCYVDVGFWGGVIPGNTQQLEPLLREGVLGFKCFLSPSGVDEFPNVTEADLWQALPELARLGAVLLVHAEAPALLRPISGDPLVYRNYLDSRPREAENEAIALLIRGCRAFGTRIHIVHLSSADAIPMIRQARSEGLPLTVETCPHYLTFAAEDIPRGATEFKCAPPIRERENRERLRAALQEGVIDMVCTDHSPCPPEMKSGDFGSAWGGIASLQLSLAVMGGAFACRWMAAAPAKLAGLHRRKGAIAPGLDADIVIWNPAGRAIELQHRHKLTPYRLEDFPGAVEATFLRGQKIYECGRFASSPQGAILQRSAGPDLLACCGSLEWGRRMEERQPFASASEMLAAADRIWWELRPVDWLQAFAAHPRIGESTADARARQEQSGVQSAEAETLARLAAGNRAYEERFGYIYIVCASGKTAAQMLAILESRLSNDPETELRVAAEQQRQITRLRLEKWMMGR
jgi:allantoinase